MIPDKPHHPCLNLFIHFGIERCAAKLRITPEHFIYMLNLPYRALTKTQRKRIEDVGEWVDRQMRVEEMELRK
jgi:hypothetical protein